MMTAVLSIAVFALIVVICETVALITGHQL